jgi:septal ring factor EnvC (AmiA/AmiB activator)
MATVKLDNERVAKLETQVEGIKEDVAAVKQDIKELHSRVTTVTREITDHVDTKFNILIDRDRDHDLKTVAMISCIEQIKVGVAEVHDCLDRTGTSLEEKLTKVKDRLDILERWRYMIVGGAIALGYALAHADFFTKFLK